MRDWEGRILCEGKIKSTNRTTERELNNVKINSRNGEIRRERNNVKLKSTTWASEKEGK